MGEAQAGASHGRVLGIWSCIALVIGNMVGSGIFMLPASLAPFGINALWGWLVAVVGTILLAIVFARLARALPGRCGPFAYPAEAFGPQVGFMVAWVYWISIWAAAATLLVGITSYAVDLLPFLKAIPGAKPAFCLVLFWFLTALNLRGVQTMASIQIVTTFLKMLPLLAVVAIGVFIFASQGEAAIVATPQPIEFGSVATTASLSMWALIGFEVVTVSAQRAIDPERTVVRALIWGTVAVGLIYIVTCMSIILLLPTETATQASAPFAEFLRRYWGAGAAAVVAVFAMISGIGTTNCYVLIQADLLRAMGESGVLPRILARQSRRGVPAIAMFVSGTIVSVYTLTNFSPSLVDVYTFMLKVSTGATLFPYVVVSAAALKLAATGRLAVLGNKVRGTAVIAVLGGLYGAWALYGLGAEADLWCLGLGLMAIPFYIATRLFAGRAERKMAVT